jgi:hypothetical protein
MTLDTLEKLMKAAKMKYFRDPDRPALMFPATGLFGTYQFVVILDVDGAFLQFRTLSYLHCEANHPHNYAVLKVLEETNYRLRLVKFGWDPQDGEIVAYVDHWVMDGSVTEAQFERMLGSLLPSVDMASARIKKTMETGTDPGEFDPTKALEEAVKTGGSSSGLSDLLKKVREKLAGGKKTEGPDTI